MTNEEYWLDFMMQRELGMPSPEGDNHLFMATATFLSFVFFGLFPLLPYILFRSSENLFFYSSVAAAVALSSLGVLRMLVAKKSWLRSIGETLLLGGTAAAVAYFVGTLFHL
jgi:VIT1/CCC1 family predicted Fe2+/Mn2+ transporter